MPRSSRFPEYPKKQCAKASTNVKTDVQNPRDLSFVEDFTVTFDCPWFNNHDSSVFCRTGCNSHTMVGGGAM